jgi:tetratricopeptide (TPR) repeat protein
MPDPVESLYEGMRAEKLGVLDRALVAYEAAAGASPDPDVVAQALTRQADVHRTRCEWDLAADCAKRASDVAMRAGLSTRHAEAMNAMALVLISKGALNDALPVIQAIIEASPDARVRGIALQNLGTIRAQLGQLGAAERAFAESYGYFQQCGYERGQAIALNNQGRVALDRGDALLAEEVLDRALAAARAVEDSELIALSMLNYAEAILARDATKAEQLACSALGYFQGSNNSWRSVECLRLLGSINELQGSVGEAARCYQRALEMARTIDARVEITALMECLRKLDKSNKNDRPKR